MDYDDFKTVLKEDGSCDYSRLSEYLNILGNSSRLKILKSIEKNPKDAREISGEIGTSYENTKKHLTKLENIGIIKKEPGFGKQTSKGVHAVWKYSPVPGSLDLLVRRLGVFCHMNVDNPDIRIKAEEIIAGLKDDVFGERPILIVLGGEDDGRVYIPGPGITIIGRADPVFSGQGDEAVIVEISEKYLGVTRVSRPHAKILVENGIWLIQDCGSTGGTAINGRSIHAFKKADLSSGDLIELGRGEGSVTLLFHEYAERPAGEEDEN